MNDEPTEKHEQPSMEPKVEQESDQLRLQARNQWLERELRRMNRIVELLTEELKSKVNVDNA
jgi:hypothetical protein